MPVPESCNHICAKSDSWRVWAAPGPRTVPVPEIRQLRHAEFYPQMIRMWRDLEDGWTLIRFGNVSSLRYGSDIAPLCALRCISCLGNLIRSASYLYVERLWCLGLIGARRPNHWLQLAWKTVPKCSRKLHTSKWQSQGVVEKHLRK